jgi:hypothetical protein
LARKQIHPTFDPEKAFGQALREMRVKRRFSQDQLDLEARIPPSLHQFGWKTGPQLDRSRHYQDGRNTENPPLWTDWAADKKYFRVKSDTTQRTSCKMPVSVPACAHKYWGGAEKAACEESAVIADNIEARRPSVTLTGTRFFFSNLQAVTSVIVVSLHVNPVFFKAFWNRGYWETSGMFQAAALSWVSFWRRFAPV